MIRKAKWAPEVRFTLLCVLLIFHRILFANSVYYFKGWVEKHITVNSMTSFSDDILIIFDNLVPRALFPGFAVGAPPPKPEKSTLGTRLNFGKISSCDSHVTLTWYWFLRKGECGRHLIHSSWDSQGRDIGQLSYIIAQQGSSKEMQSLGLSYTIMGYTTISFRRLGNLKIKLTSWEG